MTRRRHRDPATELPPELFLSNSELPVPRLGPRLPETARRERLALATLLVLATLAVAALISKLLIGLALGAVCAFTLQSPYRRLAARLGDHRRTAAAIVTLLFGMVLAGASALTLYLIGVEIASLASSLKERLATGSLETLLGKEATRLADRIGIDKSALLSGIADKLSSASGYGAALAASTARTAGGAVAMLLIALITMYYVLLEAGNFALRLERVLPLDPRHTRALVLEVRDVARSALQGTIATAVLQGALAGVGFTIASVPHPLTWALATALAAFVPLIGTVLVWGPVAAFVLVRGDLFLALFAALWGALVVVGFVDYAVRPRLLGAGGHGHPLLMLIALLGGIETLGFPGLLLGPILMSLFIAIVRIYERDADVEGAAGGRPAIGPPPGP